MSLNRQSDKEDVVFTRYGALMCHEETTESFVGKWIPLEAIVLTEINQVTKGLTWTFTGRQCEILLQSKITMQILGFLLEWAASLQDPEPSNRYRENNAEHPAVTYVLGRRAVSRTGAATPPPSRSRRAPGCTSSRDGLQNHLRGPERGLQPPSSPGGLGSAEDFGAVSRLRATAGAPASGYEQPRGLPGLGPGLARPRRGAQGETHVRRGARGKARRRHRPEPGTPGAPRRRSRERGAVDHRWPRPAAGSWAFPALTAAAALPGGGVGVRVRVRVAQAPPGPRQGTARHLPFGRRCPRGRGRTPRSARALREGQGRAPGPGATPLLPTGRLQTRKSDVGRAVRQRAPSGHPAGGGPSAPPAGDNINGMNLKLACH
ncbi:collagen, type I, alpha 1b-like [Cavia porcellus]|uniref:collagen, type I, alpha 1b-like n=1 Tax=Cavia porcellus TaxID=10141 RepID=UPI002FE3B9CE